MIGWDSVHARDAAEAIDNGACDVDLEALTNVISRRMKIRDGMPVCPICHELMEASSGRFKTVSHVHDGFTITRSLSTKTVSEVVDEARRAES
jgi:hypothetical protein